VPSETTSVQAGVLIPLKSFNHAKARLASMMTRRERSALAAHMALGVMQAAAPLPTFVVCDDDDVADWATEHGAHPIVREAPGLSAAVQSGVAEMAARGIDHLVVAHGDLPFAAAAPGALAQLVVPGEVRLVTDSRRDGTNVVSLPAGLGWRFAYGTGSCERHVAEAERLGLTIEVIEDPVFSVDLDVPDDITAVWALLKSDPALAQRCEGLSEVLPEPQDPS
jgi:2-phospho-L-lactate/phosphoenolpyruvate guanylyltransferase